MFETFEIMYLQNLNYINGEKYKNPPMWLKELLKLIKKDTNKYTIKRGLNQIARLFTIYDLYSLYPKYFEQKLSSVCEGTTKEMFLAFIEKYKDELSEFKKQVYSGDYKTIRENKKLHFWMNSGTIKISTIHSFKGWESEVVFLIVEKREDYSVSFDELLSSDERSAHRWCRFPYDPCDVYRF
jgi:superfamily I DNA/RNA helicase